MRNGKPDPEGFVMAGHLLVVDPADALVFEDSRAGLLTARSAGVRVMFVSYCADNIAGNAALATAAFTDYLNLPRHF